MSLLDASTSRIREQRLAEVRAFMETEPFPHREGVQGQRDLMVRIEADGSRSVGRFIDQRWRPVGVPQDTPANQS